MNKFKRFILQSSCLLFLFLLMPMTAKPMTAKSDHSIYIEGVNINKGKEDIGLLSMRTTLLQYSRTNPLWITNLYYYWRFDSIANLSTIYSSADKSLTAFIEFSGGVGLSYDMLITSQWALMPYFGIFLSDGLHPLDRMDIFSAEFGVELDLWSKISLFGSYNHSLAPVENMKTFRFGMMIH
ncbi:MAG: hypothetical protein OXI67_06515 [Candidatus Poribacteria bacterium]|nr:hypothetical protein [Candidatus Poribacteria bacterium]